MTEQKPNNPRSDLDERISRFQKEQDIAAGCGVHSRCRNNGFGFAVRIGTELVAALLIGVGFGILLDNWFGSKPWLMLLFFLLGAAAGIFNVYRVVQDQGGAIGYKPARRQKSGDK